MSDATPRDERLRCEVKIAELKTKLKLSLTPAQKKETKGVRLDLSFWFNGIQHWADATVVSTAHKGGEKAEAIKAAEEIKKARRHPYRQGAHSTTATKRAEDDKIGRFMLMKLIAQNQRLQGRRATDPVFHPAAFSNGSFFGRGAQRLIGTITAAYAITRWNRVGPRDAWGVDTATAAREFSRRLRAKLAQCCMYGDAAMVLAAGTPWRKKDCFVV